MTQRERKYLTALSICIKATADNKWRKYYKPSTAIAITGETLPAFVMKFPIKTSKLPEEEIRINLKPINRPKDNKVNVPDYMKTIRF